MKLHKTQSLRMILAKNLRARRRALGLSQEALAEAAGFTQVHISNIENSKCAITVDGIEGLSEALACQPGDLFHPGDE